MCSFPLRQTQDLKKMLNLGALWMNNKTRTSLEALFFEFWLSILFQDNYNADNSKTFQFLQILYLLIQEFLQPNSLSTLFANSIALKLLLVLASAQGLTLRNIAMYDLAQTGVHVFYRLGLQNFLKLSLKDKSPSSLLKTH